MINWYLYNEDVKCVLGFTPNKEGPEKYKLVYAFNPKGLLKVDIKDLVYRNGFDLCIDMIETGAKVKGFEKLK